MARLLKPDGKIVVTTLKDLREGDTVEVSVKYGKWMPAKVTRVKTVECATIISVEKQEWMKRNKFVGYHTSKFARASTNGFVSDDHILTLDSCWEEGFAEAINKADEKTEREYHAAEALNALKILRGWLNQKR